MVKKDMDSIIQDLKESERLIEKMANFTAYDWILRTAILLFLALSVMIAIMYFGNGKPERGNKYQNIESTVEGFFLPGIAEAEIREHYENSRGGNTYRGFVTANGLRMPLTMTVEPDTTLNTIVINSAAIYTDGKILRENFQYAGGEEFYRIDE